MGFWDTFKGIAGGGLFSKKFRKGAKDALFGTPEEHERQSTLLPGQQPTFDQLQAAAQGAGAGGAFGDSADYYRDLLSNDSATANAMFAPEQRRFNEEIIPGLSEQFAGMGAGGLSSSGFRNAAVGAGTDLSERLGAIRAQLRAQGAAGLAGIGQSALGNFSHDAITQQGTQGLLAPALSAVGQAYGGPALASAGNAAGNWFSSAMQPKAASIGQNKVGQNSNPYGRQSNMSVGGSGQYSPRGF